MKMINKNTEKDKKDTIARRHAQNQYPTFGIYQIFRFPLSISAFLQTATKGYVIAYLPKNYN